MENNFNIILDAFKNQIEYLMPSEISEKYRVLSAGKYKGAFKFKRSPYAREFVDTLSPMNIMRVIGAEKGSQIGLTMAGIANIILAIIKQYYGDILFMSDTDEQVKRAMTGFIDDMIRESGLGDSIGKRDKYGNSKSGTGDNMKEKKFGNGYTLHSWPGTTVGKLSSISPKYSLNDECERYVYSDKKGGSPYSLIINRHKTYQGEYKAWFVSTPEILQTSIIHPIFLQGDQRYYKIPCPHCGTKIDLKWHIQLDGKDRAGIYYKRDNHGALKKETVGYICQECGGFFKEQHKLSMYSETEYQIQNAGGTMWVNGNEYKLKNGDDPLCQWVPTVKPLDPEYGSYHISALYSGAGFHTWDAIAREWCLANPSDKPKNIDMIRTFYNQELGLPWEERSRDITSKNLSKNCRYYEVGTIPDILSKEDGNGDIVLLTCAIDLNGKLGDTVEEDDVRLDYEVTAWCSKGNEDYVTSYSIDHGSIGNFERAREARKRISKGESREAKFTYRHGYENSVWDIFEKEVLYRDWVKESGGKMRIGLCGVDTGNYTVHANQFVKKHKMCIALKGDVEGQFTNFNSDKAYFRKGSKYRLYLVEGNRIKDKIADMMELPWENKEGILQPEGYPNYPMPSNDKYLYKTYFHEYENEKKELKKDALGSPIGMRWVKKHAAAPQHFFDCRIYNIACQKIATHEYCKRMKVEVSWENYCKLMKQRI